MNRNEFNIELHFITSGSTPHRTEGLLERRQSVAVLGRFLPLTLFDLRLYARRFPSAWVVP